MQSSSVILVCGSRVISSTQAYLTRGMINTMAITLLNDAGTALDITGVSIWDLGITEDFFGATCVLAGSSTITAVESVLAVTLNCHTDELTALMDGKNSIQAYATLRGRDAESVIKRLYVFPVVILNIGFTNDTILTTAAQELIYTKAQVDYLLSQIPGAANAEVTTNKTQEIDTETPSADKYPSEAALVAYGSGKVDKVEGKVLSDNNFTTAEKNKLESALTSVPDASTTVKGIVQIATGEEVTAGEDTVKAVVPATLKTELDKKANTSAIPDITGKVDKVDGKALSTNDFTDAYKTKVNADVESVSALPTPVVGILNRVYFLTADDGTNKKGTTWKCVADGESYVMQQIQTDLNQLTDADNLLFDGDYDSLSNKPTIPPDLTDAVSGKVDKVPGYGLSKNDYTDAAVAKVAKIDLETLTELTGADVTVAPWTQSKWSASGVCSLTATGWAVSGHQVAYVLITLAAEATLSISGATVADDDALSAAGTYACYLINENGTVRFKVAGFTEAV